LLKNIFIFCAEAGGKCAPKGESKPYDKCTALDLELKMIHKYEGRESSSSFVVSTVNTS
jgi:hypothetical protein